LHGSVDQYLQLHTGELGNDLSAMAREGLRTKLRAAIHKAMRENHQVSVGGISIQRDRSYITARITVEPIKGEGERDGLFLVSFQLDSPATKSGTTTSPQAETVGHSHAHATESDYEIIVAQLEEHLRATREDLQSTIEELETSNEEFKAA